MTVEEMAKIIEAEASVLPYEGKLGVAQCIKDLNYNAKAFTTPYPTYSEGSLKAAKEVKEQGKNRIENSKILKLRSFTNYSNGKGEPDYAKIRSGKDPIPETMEYLGKDYKDNTWGQFYFGEKTEENGERMPKFKLLVIAGHGDGDPGACGNGYQEANLNRELAKLIVMDANKTGCIDATLADTNKNYYKFLKNGGSFDFTPYNYVLEVHFNASSKTDYVGDGVIKGSMFYISQSEKGHSVEDKILSNLYGLGSCKAWDGVVVSQRQWASGLLVQERVRAQGVSHGLLETCFISDKDDIYWYQKNKIMISSAIIAGIVSGFGLKTIPVQTFSEYMVRVKKLNVPIRTGAGIQYTVNSICPIGTYTIIEEKQGRVDQKNLGTWCKLKSGAGWLYLGDVEKVK